ncbi:MAG: glycosyl hydrolase 43 family protein [Bacteroidaceae bacterium]|nr:glycosyl hydrolase 43 family protein [Bacteroidaceae bacterium]
MKLIILFFTFMAFSIKAYSNGNVYFNPIINEDYSDPDVIAAADGSGYYMTASSFASTPALPILFSEDLVNWEIVNYALDYLEPREFYDGEPKHGKGVWAPSLRYHNGFYYIVWGDPDYGVFKITAANPKGKWSKPELIIPGKGLIDACPLWDDDGRAYIVNAWAGSRAKFNSVLTIREMTPNLAEANGQPVIVYDGNSEGNHTVEGPKLYKRNGIYYILAPAGGVEQGWQLAMRSDRIFGPYQCRTVMAQGNSEINGPHQGGWIEAPDGSFWFINFQDKAWLGRVIHLNPLKWVDGWPVIGVDDDNDGCGFPVRFFSIPNAKTKQLYANQYTDTFDGYKLPLRWQWSGNYDQTFGFPSTQGFARIYGWNKPTKNNLWTVPNLLLQKCPGDEFTATAHLRFTVKNNTEYAYAGLVLFGQNYGAIAIREIDGNLSLVAIECRDAEQCAQEIVTKISDMDNLETYQAGSIPNQTVEMWLRVDVGKKHQCSFSWSFDGINFNIADVSRFTARQGKWVGARIGVFATNGENGDKCWLDLLDFNVNDIKTYQ